VPYLDFFADFAVSGQVAGVGLNSRPADWPLALGNNFSEASFHPGHLIRGFGFIEANFEDDTGEWLCDLIHIKPDKVHRFPGMIPPVIGERYGEFPARIGFADVAEALAAAGAEVRHIPRTYQYSPEIYWVPEGKVMFEVVSPEQADQFKVLMVGDVFSVTTDTRIDLADHGTRYR
jgi:hypothetical protein